MGRVIVYPHWLCFFLDFLFLANHPIPFAFLRSFCSLCSALALTFLHEFRAEVLTADVAPMLVGGSLMLRVRPAFVSRGPARPLC